MATSKHRIFNLMMDCKWHSTAEIIAVGGSGAMRRIRELRQAIRTGVGYPSYLEGEIKKIKDVEQRSYAVGSLNQLFEYRFSKQAKAKRTEELPKVTEDKEAVMVAVPAPHAVQPEVKNEGQLVAVEGKKVETVAAAIPELPIAQPDPDNKKEWDRESYIVQRKAEMEELTGRSASRAWMVPVRSLASSRLPLVGGTK